MINKDMIHTFFVTYLWVNTKGDIAHGNVYIDIYATQSPPMKGPGGIAHTARNEAARMIFERYNTQADPKTITIFNVISLDADNRILNREAQ